MSVDPEVLKLETKLAEKISSMVLILEKDPDDFDKRAKTINTAARKVLVIQLAKVTDPRVVAVRERLRELNK